MQKLLCTANVPPPARHSPAESESVPECIDLLPESDPEADVVFVKQTKKTQVKKRLAKQASKQNERLLKFHNYVLEQTRKPIFDDSEIYRNHPVIFRKP